MAQKTSYEEIEKRADRAAYIKTGDTPEEFEPYKAGFIHGATWCRDNHDPWHYVSDGELPYDSSQLGEDRMLMTDEVLVIFHSGKRYVLQYQANGEEYSEDLWRDPKTGDSYDKYSVKCWQTIEEPQK